MHTRVNMDTTSAFRDDCNGSIGKGRNNTADVLRPAKSKNGSIKTININSSISNEISFSKNVTVKNAVKKKTLIKYP